MSLFGIWKELKDGFDELVDTFEGEKFSSEAEMDKAVRLGVEEVFKDRMKPIDKSAFDATAFEDYEKGVIYVKRRLLEPPKVQKPQPELERQNLERQDSEIELFEGSPSLVRVSHHAGALSVACVVRERLWGSKEPPYPASSSAEVEVALDKAKADAAKPGFAEYGYLVETIVYKKAEQGKIPPERPADARRISIQDYHTVFGVGMYGTEMAVDLKIAVDMFRAQYPPAWINEKEAATLLLTGYLPRLSSTTVIADFSRREPGLLRSYMMLNVHDVRAAPLKQLQEVIKSIYRRKVNAADGRFDFRIADTTYRINRDLSQTGRPVSILDETLAFLELDLILAEARKRVARNETITPGTWTWRPSNETLREAWEKRASEFGQDPERELSAQKLGQFRNTVSRDIYIIGLLQFFSAEDEAWLSKGNRDDKAFADDLGLIYVDFSKSGIN